jgi:hypothetical protein
MSLAGELGLHVGWQLAEEDGVYEVISLMMEHIENLVATLQGRDGVAM